GAASRREQAMFDSSNNRVGDSVDFPDRRGRGSGKRARQPIERGLVGAGAATRGWPGLCGDADALTPVLKAGVTFYNHANGTVRMGPRSDPQAVVDATGAVRGVAGLSVADASIMPTPPSNVTTLTTM